MTSTFSPLVLDMSFEYRINKISQVAHQKWLRRSLIENPTLYDWLEAEAEIAYEEANTARITELEERLRRLVEESDENKKRQLAEHTISKILATAGTLSDVAPTLIQILGECFGWDVGAIWVLDRDANMLRCLEFWHSTNIQIPAFEKVSRQRTFCLGEGLPGEVWACQKLVWTSDVTSEDSFPRKEIAAQEGLHGAVGFPIHNGDEIISVLEFFSREVAQPDTQTWAMMTCIANNLSQFMERREAEKQVHIQKQEQSIGRRIQEGLLPQVMPRLPGYQISARSTAISVGGDSFDFIPLPKAPRECIGVFIGDACGHGIGAALLMAQTHSFLRALALTSTDVTTLLELTNQCLCDNPNSKFVTALLLILDTNQGLLNFTGAGHLPGFVLDSGGLTKSFLCSVGLPMGMIPKTCYPASTIQIEPGDLILLMTDGITEAMSLERELFGIERTLEVVRKHQQQAPEEILNELFFAVSEFCHNQHQDDLTAMVIKADDN